MSRYRITPHPAWRAICRIGIPPVQVARMLGVDFGDAVAILHGQQQPTREQAEILDKIVEAGRKGSK